MPQIIPIRDLKNTSELSIKCHQTNEPIFVTKNGYGDLVVMSIEAYEKSMFLLDLYEKIGMAELDAKEGRVTEAKDAIMELRKKYDI